VSVSGLPGFFVRERLVIGSNLLLPRGPDNNAQTWRRCATILANRSYSASFTE
jgi:hypothetical protein